MRTAQKVKRMPAILLIIIFILLVVWSCGPKEEPDGSSETDPSVTTSETDSSHDQTSDDTSESTTAEPATSEPITTETTAPASTTPAPTMPPATTVPTTTAVVPIIYIGQILKIPSTDGNATGVSQVINQGVLSVSGKQIALTFDAGWLYDQTGALLNVLDSYNVKSTFFLRGYWASEHPDLVRAIAGRGHAVENHSLTHSHMMAMSDAEIRNEMVQSTNIITNITGVRPHLFRPPFGEYDSRMLPILGEEGYAYTVMWTVDSHDWAEVLNGVTITEPYLINRVLANATDNGIVLMHVGGYHTVEALPEIIEGLRSAGYNLVKVNDMLPSISDPDGYIYYTVVKGDTLYGISRKYNVTIEEIIALNNLR